MDIRIVTEAKFMVKPPFIARCALDSGIILDAKLSVKGKIVLGLFFGVPACILFIAKEGRSEAA